MRAFWVTVAEADEDEAIAALWEAGTAGVEVREAPGGRLRLLAYFEDEASRPSDGSPASAVLSAGWLPWGRGRLPPSATIEPAEVADVDWVARFREGFHAFRAGRFLVAPPWDLPADERDVLVVDPGRAFGTGTHETTRLCLATLEHLAGRRKIGRTLDLGAGTGLLAVAAVRLGASFVCASDLDREANHASRHHARLNGVRLAVVQADGGRGFRRGCFDLVLANLMALLLVDRAAEIRALVAPGGALVLSGLLLQDVPFVREAFAACGRVAGSRETADSDIPAESQPGQMAAARATTGSRGTAVASGSPRVVVDGEWAALVYEDVP